MELSYVIFSVFLVVGKYDSAPVYSNINTISPSLSAINFMKEYGYLESGTADSDALYEKSAITNAVKTLQEFGNIPVTGQLDNTTLKCQPADISTAFIYVQTLQLENSRRA
ncbi:uncharacterized protein isoform X1 [Bombus fervidus]|uniref:uncharacterized protein isoform X1 n=1 Tax=Bombus fervidus TaxID=203811 RepID=UPI003D187ACC